MIYYAHSGHQQDKSDWQTLEGHLVEVATLAKHNARYFGAGELAYLAGLLHDLGKYTPEFQARLAGATRKVDHATAGAKEAAQFLPHHWHRLISYAIAGHHAGLANGIHEGDNRSTLEDRLKQVYGTDLPKLDAVWKSQLPFSDSPNLFPNMKPSAQQGIQFALLIRMIFSCLVDADFIDTDKFYKQLEGKPWLRGQYPELAQLKIVFDAYLVEKTKNASISNVNQLRQEILVSARKKASLPTGLFSLTVPTGGGKTFSSMAFALDHALTHNLRRIIYVIPFTSIIEQNAKVFREAFGELGELAVLEHHSNFDDSSVTNESSQDKLKLAMENWDMPIVVTTAVQFFESLFADRPSRCRKLHNISGSVIILDEAQTLPLKYLKPVMAVIDELARNYQCSIVLCTATQPALCQPDFEQGFTNVREIAPNPERLFDALSLVSISHLGELDDDALLVRMESHQQILTIVNNRRHAQMLFQQLQDKDVEGIFHLTTLMCATHRSQILDTIRQRLIHQQPCRVISTSLIEAGVDIDFPCVMREETGLDSIAQAAGRCNRERKRSKEDSQVWIFTAPPIWKIPNELKVLASGTKAVLRRGYENLLGQTAIKAYFSEVYWHKGDELDKENLLPLHKGHTDKLTFPFQDIAQCFRLIESVMKPIFIPFDAQAKALLKELETTDSVSAILRRLQPYIVQIPQQGFNILMSAGVIQTIAPHRFNDQFWLLINDSLYDQNCGLSWDNPTFIEADKLIF